jgi:hypothetical protein
VHGDGHPIFDGDTVAYVAVRDESNVSVTASSAAS